MLAIIMATQIFAFAQGSKLWIEGDSNVHPWSCKAATPTATLEVDQDLPQIAKSLSLDVPIDKMDCGDGKMNEKMREALHAEENPVIYYRLRRAERISGEALQLKATGDLTINGRTRTVAFLVDVTTHPDGTADASGQVVINMTDFGVEPPKALLGMIKAYDRVTVKFEVRTAAPTDLHASK